ncbi:10316_t:CDS:2 [Gigaspora margarita]|uniref:Delta-12 fatty acid desaturase n=2 Tax=Gigaspora margarita TaxID=4874 RepID=A0A8H3ZZK0_GIGMA|nr:delta-12 fatty acid desaturase [Gigaspora margarita]CAG8525082.1 10316_t:CDS:2 [Gigaspora margarita]
MTDPNIETKLSHRQTAEPKVDKVTKFERDYEPPSFTFKEIREAIPSHCFERDTLRSASYVVKDLSIIAVLVYSATLIDVYLPQTLRFVAWLVYWFFCGAFATGLWVIAHECGHQAFSSSKFINDTVGFILHSALLVPYHSWKITHAKHHNYTAHVDKDQVFVPKTRKLLGLPPKNDQNDHDDGTSILEDTPIYSLFMLLVQQLIGWPLYLIFNTSGQVYKNRWVNHFNPSSPIFDPKHYNDIIISDIGLIISLSIIGYFSYIYSFMTVVKYYLIPYLIVNHWLVLITYLQHTDPKLPHYRENQWSFVRGAACTVDRHFGFLDSIFHRISSTHVAHHYFSKMPHYHAEEATIHIKKVLGTYYMFDDTPIIKALWRSHVQCRFIEDEGDVLFYKK